MQIVKLVCWNIRSLVESKGGIETARVGKDGRREKEAAEGSHNVDMGVEMVWCTCSRISEAKWLGNNIYEVDDYTILHSGYTVPGNGEQVKRGEGVGLALAQKPPGHGG